MLEHVACLQDREARHAFIHTVRAVMDLRGQRIDAPDRLYLANHVPMMIVWGDRDRLIPVTVARRSHAACESVRGVQGGRPLPPSRRPARFVEILLNFMETTEPADVTDADFRDLLRGE